MSAISRYSGAADFPLRPVRTGLSFPYDSKTSWVEGNRVNACPFGAERCQTISLRKFTGPNTASNSIFK